MFRHSPKLINQREIPLGISAAMNYTSCYALAFLFSLYFANLPKQSDDCFRNYLRFVFLIPAIALRLWLNDNHHKIAMTFIPSDADSGELLYQNLLL